MVLKNINNAMIMVKEYDVKNPRTYVFHPSKVCLAKKMGQKDVDPLFKLPRRISNVLYSTFSYSNILSSTLCLGNIWFR